VGPPAVRARRIPPPASAVGSPAPVARVVALIGDLLFGSQVKGSLVAAGHEVELVSDRDRTHERLADAPAVLVVDLVDEDLDGAALIESLTQEGALEQTRTLGFYSHVDARARERAEQAGFDLVIPRSRMAREGAALVTRLAANP
jgi:CheY-like chemotaxis protein